MVEAEARAVVAAPWPEADTVTAGVIADDPVDRRRVEILDREGRLLAAAAEGAGTEAKVPTCPDWRVRDLLRHTGMVHRWAAAFVAEGHMSYHPDGGLPDLDGAELLAWFREGHRYLVGTLASAPGKPNR